MAIQKSTFRHRGPEWFHASELERLAMVRMLAPSVMPALAALAVLPPGWLEAVTWPPKGPLGPHIASPIAARVVNFKWDAQGNIVEYAGAQLLSQKTYGWNEVPVKIMIIRPAFEIAALSHVQAPAADLRARLKRQRKFPSAWGTEAAFARWGKFFCECPDDPRWCPPPQMTPDEAHAALSAATALPYLLADPHPAVREWAIKDLVLSVKPRRISTR